MFECHLKSLKHPIQISNEESSFNVDRIDGSSYLIYACKIIECEARRMTNLIIIAFFYIFGNIIVGLEWSDPLDYVATLYIIHTNTNINLKNS